MTTWKRNPETRKAHLVIEGVPLCEAVTLRRGLVDEHSPPKRNRRCKGCLAKATGHQITEANAASRERDEVKL
jgi:hypothetical protein